MISWADSPMCHDDLYHFMVAVDTYTHALAEPSHTFLWLCVLLSRLSLTLCTPESLDDTRPHKHATSSTSRAYRLAIDAFSRFHHVYSFTIIYYSLIEASSDRSVVYRYNHSPAKIRAKSIGEILLRYMALIGLFSQINMPAILPQNAPSNRWNRWNIDIVSYILSWLKLFISMEKMKLARYAIKQI